MIPSICLSDIVQKIQSAFADFDFKKVNLAVILVGILVLFIIIVYLTNFSILPVKIQENLINSSDASQPLPVCCVPNVSAVKDVLNEQGEAGVYEYGRAILPAPVKEFLRQMFEEQVRPVLKDPRCMFPLGNQLELLDWLFVRIAPRQDGSVAYHTEGILTNTADHTTLNFFWRFSVSPQYQYTLHELRPMSEKDSYASQTNVELVKKTPADELRKTYLPPTVYDKNAYVSFTPDFNHPNLHDLSSDARDLFSRTKRVMGRSI